MKLTLDKDLQLFSIASGLIFFVYTNIKAAKDSIFLAFVGQGYVPVAKICLIFAAVVFLFPLYPRLLARFGRRRMLVATSWFYAIFCVVGLLGILLLGAGKPGYLAASRAIFGWAFYVTADLFSFFVLQTFWSTLSCSVSPEWSSKHYWIPASFGQLVGILGSLLGWATTTLVDGTRAFALLLSLSSVAMVALACVIRAGKALEGRGPDGQSAHISSTVALKKVFNSPYLIATLGLVFSFYLVSSISEFQLQCALASQGRGFASIILKQMFIYTGLLQTIGFLAAISATKLLPKTIGVAKTLLLGPLIGCSLVTGVLVNPAVMVALSVHVCQKGLYYGFLDPIFQMLFVPLSPDLQFIAKNFIIAFGAIFAKGVGALFNLMAIYGASQPRAAVLGLSLALALVVWLVSAYRAGTFYKGILAHSKSQKKTSVKSTEALL